MKDLSLHLMDITQNSISAGADKVEVDLSADTEKDLLMVRVIDDGSGMPPELAARVDNPFVTTRSTRKIGLGIPLLKDSARLAGGSLNIISSQGLGTSVEASFRISHIDRLPLGDIADTIADIIAAYPKVHVILKLKNNNYDFILDTEEVKSRLGGVPITEFEVLNWIKDYINEGVKTIFGGALNEITG